MILVTACISLCVGVLCPLACERYRNGAPTAESGTGSGLVLERMFHDRLVVGQLSGVEGSLGLGQLSGP